MRHRFNGTVRARTQCKSIFLNLRCLSAVQQIFSATYSVNWPDLIHTGRRQDIAIDDCINFACIWEELHHGRKQSVTVPHLQVSP